MTMGMRQTTNMYREQNPKYCIEVMIALTQFGESILPRVTGCGYEMKRCSYAGEIITLIGKSVNDFEPLYSYCTVLLFITNFNISHL